MSRALPKVYLVRDGETAWTLSGQHTGRTDVPLTERGERDAQELSARLRGTIFAHVLTSRCSGHGERANACAPQTSWPSVPAGVYSRTVARVGKPWTRWAPARIA